MNSGREPGHDDHQHHHEHDVHLIVETLSGVCSHDFKAHDSLQHVVNQAVTHLHLLLPPGDFWELSRGDQVLNLQESIHEARLHSGEKLKLAHHQSRIVTIYVNTDPHQVHRGSLTFQKIVQLAFPSESSKPDILFKVSYRRGKGDSDLKTLAEGGDVHVQEGMIFNVSYESRS